MGYWRHWQQGKELDRGQYIVEKYLGSGGFGVTYQVKEQRSGKLFTLKTLNEKQP
jgi:serine/threonine protein kinase